MAKKSKVDRKFKRKNDNASGQTKINPFEIYHNKKKSAVLGVKERKFAGMPGVSRSKALEKRKETIGVEYKKRLKKNTFTDERFGAGDTSLSVEERMLARFTKERQKHHSKQRFALEEDVLTHKGQSIDALEEFDDVYSSGGEEEKIDDKTTEFNFGGFLKKSEDDPSKHISSKDFMDQVIAKSKDAKLERQREKEEANEETEGLDADWRSLQGLLAAGPKRLPAATAKPATDYDTMVKELVFEAKAKPTNRLKTEDELAKERRELLEQLESDRQKRMRQDKTGGSESTSADALLSRKKSHTAEKVMISYDTKGNMNKNEEFEQALDTLRNKNAEKEDESSSDEESDDESDNEESGEEEESGEGEEEEEEEEDHEGMEEEGSEGEDGSDNDEAGASDEEIQDLPQIKDNGGEADDNCDFEEIIAESDEEEMAEEDPVPAHNDLSANTKGDIPFVINAPEHMSEFTALVSAQNEEAKITIIKRIIASNHPSLKEDNKAKTSQFYVILVKYLVSEYSEGSLSKLVLDESCKALFSVTKYIQRDVYTHFFDILNSLKHLIAKNVGKQLHVVMGQRYVVYLNLLQRIYPVTDFKHAVVTPVVLAVSWALSCCTVRNLADLKVGLFLCNFVLQCSQGKFCPEVIYFLSQTVRCLGSQRSDKTQEYVPNFKIRLETLADESKPGKVAISNLYENGTAKSDVMLALLVTIRTSMRIHHDFTGFNGIFHDLVISLNGLPIDKWHSDIQSLATSLVSLNEQFSQKIMPFLRYQNIKPISIKMYEPKFSEVFVRERKDKDESKMLKKKIRSETKGAIREIRKDNQFIGRVKHREQASKDKARKKKVNEIMGFLSREQGEANDLKYRKRHNKA